MNQRWMVLLALGLWQCQAHTGHSPAPSNASASDPKPLRLMVVLVIDQLRGDDLERYDNIWQYGMRRLVDEGRWYTEAFHAHGNTETASGHASIATGLTAKQHGISSQRFFDAATQKKVNVCDFGPGACGPNALLTPTVGDRLRHAVPGSRVVSLAQKARAAMLMGGKNPNLALWFGSGPTLVGHGEAFAEVFDHLQERYLHIAGPERIERLWELPKLPSPWYLREDVRQEEYDPGIGTTFPHALPPTDDVQQLYQAWLYTPDADRALVDLVLETVDHMRLGSAAVTDLLMVSLSSTDTIGHAFGPESLERPAAFVALDKDLGRLLDGLTQRFGDGVQVALTSDHGVTPMPHASRAMGHSADRVSTTALVHAVQEALAQRLGPGDYVAAFAFPFMALQNIAAEQLLEAQRLAANALLAQPGVHGAWPTSELGSANDAIAALMLESAHPGRSGDVTVVLKAHHLPLYPNRSGLGADHGSPWRADRHIPIILWGRGVQPGRVTTPVVVPDLGRSIAETLGLPTDWSSAQGLH